MKIEKIEEDIFIVDMCMVPNHVHKSLGVYSHTQL